MVKLFKNNLGGYYEKEKDLFITTFCFNSCGCAGVNRMRR
jgi:hypothetical protein